MLSSQWRQEGGGRLREKEEGVGVGGKKSLSLFFMGVLGYRWGWGAGGWGHHGKEQLVLNSVT